MTDIRFTNIDDPTVAAFVNEFDSRNFENRGISWETEYEQEHILDGDREV